MTVADEAQRCPPSEVLAAFVDARLPRMQVVALTEHMAGCAECRFVVESVSDLETEERADVPAAKSAAGSWKWMSIAAMVVIGLVLTPFALPKWHAYQRETAVREFIEAQPKNERNIEPRITGFAWAHYGVNRGDNQNDQKSDDQLIAEGKAGDVVEKTERDRSPQGLRERGVAYLFLRDNDNAIQELKAATSASPNDARAWSDLAAAYIAARQYDKAYQAADRAVQLDPKLNEARFNRALAIYSTKPAESKKEWLDYLKHDPNSPWANEARTKVELLTPEQ